MRPGADPFTERTPRVAAARRLTRRSRRDGERRFLAEGPQAVREALALGPGRPGSAEALFGTGEALTRHADLADLASALGVEVSVVTESAMAGLSETVSPQGIVAVCSFLDVPLASVLATAPRLVAVLAEIRDPGNAGTVLRTADAAGADAVVFSDASVDPYNGKCVRATAGSLFHPAIVRGGPAAEVVAELSGAGLTVLAADGHGECDLDELDSAGGLDGPTAWLFGNEARGLPAALAELATARVRIPIHGRAESLNLAAAAAITLYATARAHHRP
ncbi:MAG: methyltransferase, TrmH family [Cryptosporangiaceae bacterium]|nr:methyltransferase, TrmH family [Cryptosporangiaceae bacterium]